MTAPENPAPDSESFIDQIKSSIRYLLKFHMVAIIAVIVLSIAFASPLKDLLDLSLSTDLYSHVILMPFIVIYMLAIRKEEYERDSKPNRFLAALPFSIGLIALYRFYSMGPQEIVEDTISPAIFAYVCFIWATCVFSISSKTLPKTIFALSLLIFIVPFSFELQLLIDTFFQYTSAETAYWMFQLTDTTLLRLDTLVFQLPGITLQVATECSGIRSSLVLFITALIAGALFIKSPWKRGLLVFFVIPLAIVRNAFRIFVIGQLCIHVDPDMIHSPIHHKGGPIFFALSLIPFTLFLFLLWRSENRKKSKAQEETQ